VSWQTPEQQGLFLSSSLEELAALAELAQIKKRLRVSSNFLEKARLASCYADTKNPARKWSVLYALLWRVTKEDPATLKLTSDADVRCLDSMCKAVSRDKHKMKAFVRFQKVSGGDPDQSGELSPFTTGEHYIAWFEPSHAIVEVIAPFFVKRFTGMSWSILTPRGCAHWNLEQLKLSEGVLRPEMGADAFEDFWKTYYCSIFNTARLKEQAMRSEMPKKYWKYLPEASCIQGLTRDAAASTAQMVTSPLTSSSRVREKSRQVTQYQDQLRSKNRV
jgi:DNA polymerase